MSNGFSFFKLMTAIITKIIAIIYDTYKESVLKALTSGKSEKASERKFKKIEEIEPKPDCLKNNKTDKLK